MKKIILFIFSICFAFSFINSSSAYTGILDGVYTNFDGSISVDYSSTGAVLSLDGVVKSTFTQSYILDSHFLMYDSDYQPYFQLGSRVYKGSGYRNGVASNLYLYNNQYSIHIVYSNQNSAYNYYYNLSNSSVNIASYYNSLAPSPAGTYVQSLDGLILFGNEILSLGGSVNPNLVCETTLVNYPFAQNYFPSDFDFEGSNNNDDYSYFENFDSVLTMSNMEDLYTDFSGPTMTGSFLDENEYITFNSFESPLTELPHIIYNPRDSLGATFNWIEITGSGNDMYLAKCEFGNTTTIYNFDNSDFYQKINYNEKIEIDSTDCLVIAWEKSIFKSNEIYSIQGGDISDQLIESEVCIDSTDGEIYIDGDLYNGDESDLITGVTDLGILDSDVSGNSLIERWFGSDTSDVDVSGDSIVDNFINYFDFDFTDSESTNISLYFPTGPNLEMELKEVNLDHVYTHTGNVGLSYSDGVKDGILAHALGLIFAFVYIVAVASFIFLSFSPSLLVMAIVKFTSSMMVGDRVNTSSTSGNFVSLALFLLFVSIFILSIPQFGGFYSKLISYYDPYKDVLFAFLSYMHTFTFHLTDNSIFIGYIVTIRLLITTLFGAYIAYWLSLKFAKLN